MKKKDIVDACTRIRIASIVSDHVVDFMKDAALAALKKPKVKKPVIVVPQLRWNLNWERRFILNHLPVSNRTIGAFKRSKCGNYHIKIWKKQKPFSANRGSNQIGFFSTEAEAEACCQQHAIELVTGATKGCKIKFVEV